jgi:NADPH-dependent glutamate synthase beta subunit-like oxidoreductase
MAGYDVTVYEDNAQAGGMLRYGIPEYRLPYPSLDKDVAFIESLGVRLVMNTRVGRDIEFSRIYEENDAVYISTGQSLPSRIAIPGEDLPGVISGLNLLSEVTEGKNPQVGSSVAVIGGGNVAMDAARTSVRLGARVAVYYRRREQDMPADREEIVEGREEGVEFITQAIPLRVETRPDGKLSLIWGPADMVPDQGGRPRPVLREGEENEAVVDTIIGAIGQEADFSFIPEDTAARLGFNRKKIEVDRFGRTGDSKIFAGGDMANPTADAISAIGDGHRAARGIDEFLRGGK